VIEELPKKPDISDEVVKKLLNDARAPKVVSPERLAALTWCLTQIANRAAPRQKRILLAEETLKKMRKGGNADPVKIRRSEFQRAQAAIDELRCVVPKIIERLRLLGANNPLFLAVADDHEAWLKTVPDFVAEPPPRKRAPWTIYAKVIFHAYQEATGSCGISRGGPAVEFIKLALAECHFPGAEELTHDAIEKAFRR
jgi:hypothetical protein